MFTFQALEFAGVRVDPGDGSRQWVEDRINTPVDIYGNRYARNNDPFLTLVPQVDASLCKKTVPGTLRPDLAAAALCKECWEVIRQEKSPLFEANIYPPSAVIGEVMISELHVLYYSRDTMTSSNIENVRNEARALYAGVLSHMYPRPALTRARAIYDVADAKPGARARLAAFLFADGLAWLLRVKERLGDMPEVMERW